MELTQARLECLRVVEKCGGKIDHEHPDLAPFLDDNSTLTKPDVFNQCHDAGWLLSGYDDRDDTSTAHLTDYGRQMLMAAR